MCKVEYVKICLSKLSREIFATILFFPLSSLFSISTGQFKTRQIRNNFEINMVIKKSIYSTFYVFNDLSNPKRDKKNRGKKK